MRALDHKVPPPVVALVTGAAMWAGAWKAAALPVSPILRHAVAVGLAIFGLAVAGLGKLAFRKAKTTTNPRKPGMASTIVSGGVYRYTRNPMYLGVTAMLLGWAAYLAVPWAFLGPVLFVAYITRFQIIPEERELRSKFGNEYADYQRRVGRWF
jgi:protein-S-isoprenylcysteine O-methyltransferase Ste14